MRRLSGLSSRASWMAVIISVGALAAALTTALYHGPLPGPAAAEPNDSPMRPDTVLTVPGAALANDPFRRGRELSNLAHAAPDTMPPAGVVAVRLLGTVVRPEASFALCQLSADAPRIVHVGERLGDLKLIQLEQGRAVFQTSRGTRLELSLSNPRS